MTIGTPDAERVAVDFQVVSPGYFEVLRIPIVRGRGFDQRDRSGAEPVAIVSDTLVRRTFGKRDPIGERIVLASPLPPATIVGVNALVAKNCCVCPARIIGLLGDKETAGACARSSAAGNTAMMATTTNVVILRRVMDIPRVIRIAHH